MRILLAVLAAAVACGGGSGDDGPTGPPAPTTKLLEVINYLHRSVTLTAGTTPYGSLAAATVAPQSATISLPASAPTLNYTVAPFVYNDGSAIPSDFTGETVQLPNTDATLGINNIVRGTPHIVIVFTNSTNESLDVGIAQGSSVQCLVRISPGAAGVSFGYYALNATTEVRYYRTAAVGCTGSYRFWEYSALSGYQVNSGAIALRATILP